MVLFIPSEVADYDCVTLQPQVEVLDDLLHRVRKLHLADELTFPSSKFLPPFLDWLITLRIESIVQSILPLPVGSLTQNLALFSLQSMGKILFWIELRFLVASRD